MKWMKERDLLIAQTMAFVQSVTGKMPEAEKTIAAPVALPAVELVESARAAAPLPDMPLPVMPLPDINTVLVETTPAVPAPIDMPKELSRPAPLPRLDLRDDFQAEIRARVANFRAHQERFNREREAYCSATMARVHASLREGEPPTK
ncbi:hypothetical protein ACH79_29050 [Bradyrhizobium sp. CCBAU 051011]|jgi:hypothetical protein|uniref:hypothetical protein n=1 Tax=Bradyrhizobium sp. CCBAU 051011 TaxID=858422 RepID=UPI00137409D1|nr:hypothetical protein [Bradyrhizobium sp. CCBAU 051011]QHO76056.1 hypothetical protein ACH79_29050 [Bradyrhizobium sp. CCBAU 051011]